MQKNVILKFTVMTVLSILLFSNVQSKDEIPKWLSSSMKVQEDANKNAPGPYAPPVELNQNSDKKVSVIDQQIELNANENDAPTLLSSESVDGNSLADGEFVLQLEDWPGNQKACAIAKLPSEQKSLLLLEIANNHMCESKRENGKLLQFCSCVTLSSAKSIGAYSPIKREQLKGYKNVLEELALEQVLKESLDTFVGVAATIQKSAADINTWGEVIKPAQKKLLQCSYDHLSEFMENVVKDCKPRGVKRIKNALKKFNLDIFPDKNSADSKENFNKIFKHKLHSRVKNLRPVDGDSGFGAQTLMEKNEIAEVKKGNDFIYKVLKENKSIKAFNVDENKTACEYMLNGPFESYEFIRGMFIEAKKQGKINRKKIFKTCNDPISAKEVVASNFEVVINTFESQRRKLFEDDKNLDEEKFNKIVLANYREEAQDLYNRCIVAQKRIHLACKLSEKKSFAPSDLAVDLNVTNVQKAASDTILKLSEYLNFSPKPSAAQIRAQLDQLMCFTHGDAKGLVSSDAINYAKTIKTFQKTEELKNTLAIEDDGASWESESDTIKLEKDASLARINNESNSCINKDFERSSSRYEVYNEKSGLKKANGSNVTSKLDVEESKAVESEIFNNSSISNSENYSPSQDQYNYKQNYDQFKSASGETIVEPKKIVEAAKEKLEEATEQQNIITDYNKINPSSLNEKRLSSLEDEISRLRSIIEKQNQQIKDSEAQKIADAKAASAISPGATATNAAAAKESPPPASTSTFASAPEATIAPRVPSFSPSTFPANGTSAKAFAVVNTKKANFSSRYASFKNEEGKEIVVDLSSPDVLVLSQYQFANGEDEIKSWYDKTNGKEPIYIMDKFGTYKRAIYDEKMSKLEGRPLYRCINNNSELVGCIQDDSSAVSVQAKRPPLTDGTIVETDLLKKKRNHAAHADLIKKLQEASAKKIKP